MSYLEDLYRTYVANEDHVGNMLHAHDILFPIAHSTQKAQLEVVVNQQGNFRRAETVEKIDAETMIPVTEDSAARSSGIAPHPLCDKLIYVAGDYQDYSDKKKAADYYEAYITNLAAWQVSPYTHPKVGAIYGYLLKGCLMHDLITAGVLETGPTDPKQLIAKKIQNISPMDFFVRFRVEGGEYSGSTATWQDVSLFDSFIAYYIGLQGKKDLCYITGKEINCSAKHPSKIRHAGDKAKLISANDSSGFTFRGNYTEPGQLASVGYETSQKAHSALRWLLRRQGYKGVYLSAAPKGNEPKPKNSAVGSIVAWEVHGVPIPMPTDSSSEMLEEAESWVEEETKFSPQTQEEYGRRIAKAIKGYRKAQADLAPHAQDGAKVVIMAVDAATVGRLAVTYYQNIDGSSFLDNLEKWFESFVWEFREKRDARTEYVLKAPALKHIVTWAFGTEQGAFVKMGNDSLLRSQVERMIPCIIQKHPLPRDIIQALVNRASTPLSYEFHNWQNILAVACALIRKDRNDRLSENWNIRLDPVCTDRSYLFGRLLAVADWLEFSTFSPGESRDTNAKKLFFAFSQNPKHTWYLLSQSLQVYLEKMTVQKRRRFEKLLGNISLKMAATDFDQAERLSELYLLGYYHQQADLRWKPEVESAAVSNVQPEVESEGLAQVLAASEKELLPSPKSAYTLEKLSADRSYLFGCLLAIADTVEELSLDRQDKRGTLAKHFFAPFIHRPATTWAYILRQLQPYFSKMPVSQDQFYQYLLERVYNQFSNLRDSASDHALDEGFILGYYQQKGRLAFGQELKQTPVVSFSLTESAQSTGYLFGRLFAIADWLEYLTFDPGERRETNARRLFNVFPRDPYQKWWLLRKAIEPYLRKLGWKRRLFEQQLDAIAVLFLAGDSKLNQPLTPLYLQGYFQQKLVLRSTFPKLENKKED